ncbi:MAG: hypothetical protein HeimC3_41040 [Candidatus Heimdallarchaeota archaeon LC_3]|nr:MAG: hypothetical protein HeimC3_41040 [Candidatus Heimdallarchaeota archaeon LC_3]
MRKQISFAINYDKLNQKTFCTLRGFSWMEETFRFPTIIKIKRQVIGYAQVLCRKLVNVSELPLEFLQYDVSPFVIKRKGDFYDYVNNLRNDRAIPIGVIEGEWQAEMTLIYLTWMSKLKKLDYWMLEMLS